MNSKTLHILGVVIAVALAVAMALQKVRPQWAAPLGIVVALLTDLKGLITAAMARAVVSLFAVLFLGHALFGCAHVTAVAKACKPAPADVDTALADLQSDGWEAALEAFAIAKGLCIAKAAVQQVVDALGGKAELAMPLVGPSSADIVTRGRTWLAAHP